MAVGDGAVKQDMEDSIARTPFATHLHDENFNLEGLELLGEDVPDDLTEGVGQALGGDVLAAVGEPFEVGVPDGGLAEVLKLAVLARSRECDAVVNLADLV